MGKDTDRDIFSQIVNLISECKTLIETINDNKYVAHIVTQPTDQVAAIGADAVFSLSANNVKSYQWQYSTDNEEHWSNSNASGNKTDTMTTQANEARYGYFYRCKITGLDNNTIYSNSVKILRPET